MGTIIKISRDWLNSDHETVLHSSTSIAELEKAYLTSESESAETSRHESDKLQWELKGARLTICDNQKLCNTKAFYKSPLQWPNWSNNYKQTIGLKYISITESPFPAFICLVDSINRNHNSDQKRHKYGFISSSRLTFSKKSNLIGFHPI